MDKIEIRYDSTYAKKVISGQLIATTNIEIIQATQDLLQAKNIQGKVFARTVICLLRDSSGSKRPRFPDTDLSPPPLTPFAYANDAARREKG